MVTVIMIMVVLLSITGAGLLFSGLNLKQAGNLKAGSAALHVADAGIQHALAVIPTGTDFTYGAGATAVSTTVFPNAASGYSYTVTATNNPSTSASTSTAVLTSTATGPNNSKRKIKAYIGRSSSSWVPPGAVYIPGSSASVFDVDNLATNWTATGNDTNYDNTAGPQPSITGISAASGALADTIEQVLDTDAKRQRVQGAGYNPGPPVKPSVRPTTRNDDVNAIAQNFINQVTLPTCPPKCLSGLEWNSTTCPASTPCTLGTDAAPQITYITGGTAVLDGYVNGSGVLVVKDAEVYIRGNVNFHGLVVHLKPSEGTVNMEFHVSGNAKIYGAALLGRNNSPLEFKVTDSGAIRYSSQAINMVNSNWGSCCLPQPARLIAWHEVMQ